MFRSGADNTGTIPIQVISQPPHLKVAVHQELKFRDKEKIIISTSFKA